VPPRRPADRLRIGRTKSRWAFSECNPAALPGSRAGITAEEVSFLKRDPHGQALETQRPHFMKLHTSATAWRRSLPASGGA